MPSAATYPTVAHRWFEEVWNKDNESAIDELAAPDAQAYGFPEPGSVAGRDGFKAAFRQFRSAFSDIHITVEDTVAQDYKLAVRWTARMRHTGPGLGFPPTGAPVTLHGMSFMEQRNGLLIRGWNAFELSSTVARLQTLAAK